MEIQKHPVWKKIKPYKKPVHQIRFFIASNLAKLYPKETFIGITGSVGKTATKEACLAVLSQKYVTIASKDNIDPIFNIPMTLLRLRPKIKKVILEMGVEYPGEMAFYLSLVRPATGIITRISFAHSEFLGGPEEVLQEKGSLIRQLPKEGFAILNWDDLYCRRLIKETAAQVLLYGTDPKKCDIFATNVRIENACTRFELNFGVERVEVVFKLLGKHFIYPALAAAALGISCGLSLINIKKGLEVVTPIPHRLRIFEGLGGWYVLDDTYNSSPAAVEEALNVLNELPARRRIAVLGEMKELGLYSERLHRQIAQKIYKDKIDLVILGGGDTKYIADELLKLGFVPEKLESNLSNPQIVAKIIRSANRGDIVLVKGSRLLKLDEVVQRIVKQ